MTWNHIQEVEGVLAALVSLALAAALIRAGWGRLRRWPLSGWLAVAWPFVGVLLVFGYAAGVRGTEDLDQLTGPAPALLMGLMIAGEFYLLWRVISGTLLDRDGSG